MIEVRIINEVLCSVHTSHSIYYTVLSSFLKTSIFKTFPNPSLYDNPVYYT